MYYHMVEINHSDASLMVVAVVSIHRYKTYFILNLKNPSVKLLLINNNVSIDVHDEFISLLVGNLFSSKSKK